MNLRYQIRLEVCFIVVLLAIILVFYLFQKFNTGKVKVIEVYITDIQAIQIVPKTYQSPLSAIPQPVKPAIPVESEEIELLDNIMMQTQIDASLRDEYGALAPVEVKNLPYTPRQLFEVLPEETHEKINGEVKLLLKIDVDGQVADYKITSNTINNETYLKSIIEAATRSRWAPAVINERPVIYWVEKRYTFR